MVLRILCLSFVIFAADTLADSSRTSPPKRIALTFDDAPRSDGPFLTGPERGKALIDGLDRAGVAGAMFFVTTRNLESRGDEGYERLRRYVRAGHALGNHSHSHPSPRSSAAGEYLADIDRSIELLSGLEGTAPLFRFPFLNEGTTREWRDTVRRGLADRQLKNGYVTVDNYDWYLAALAKEAVEAGHDVDLDALRDFYVETIVGSIEFYDHIARQTLDRSPRHVLLLHENDLAALFVRDLVMALAARGWKVIPATEAYADPIAERIPDTMFLNQGRVAALAHEDGWKRRDLVHSTEDEAYLRARFVELGLLPEP